MAHTRCPGRFQPDPAAMLSCTSLRLCICICCNTCAKVVLAASHMLDLMEMKASFLIALLLSCCSAVSQSSCNSCTIAAVVMCPMSEVLRGKQLCDHV